MLNIKHYSFDLWLTLIRSHPDFKPERAKLFTAKYNPLGKSYEEVLAVFRRIDDLCNTMNEKTGRNISSEEMYLMVIADLAESNAIFKSIDLNGLYAEVEELVLTHCPVFYDESIYDFLASLNSKTNATCSILSNTAFIKGSTLRKVLKKLEIYSFFDFQIYSDEQELSKPNAALFSIVYEEASKLHTTLLKKEIMHVGDNPIADFDGASQFGFEASLIHSNGQKLMDIY